MNEKDGFEEEREDYFRRLSGVAQWDDAYFGRTSNYGWQPQYHPAMIGGRRARRRSSAEFWRDVGKAALFLGILFALLLVILALAQSGQPG